MSDFDAYESDMGWLKRLSDEDIERVLASSYAGEDRGLDDLAAFARDAKAALHGAPGEAARQTHLAAMAEVADTLEGAPVAVGAAAPSKTRRWKLVLGELLATLTAKVALMGVALAATTGGLAAAGALPDPAQNALANAAAKVGFELPAGDEDDETTRPEDLPEPAQGSAAAAVLEVIRNYEGDKGCEFGHAVARAAGGNPGPCTDEQGGKGLDDSEGKPEGAGKPEGTPGGKPEGAGKPEGTPSGPEDAGKPDSTPSGQPEGAGKPEGTPSGQPEGAGKPEGTPGEPPEDEDNDASEADDAGPPADLPGKP